MTEFLSSPHHSDKRAFFNAIKYLSAFPVIFLSAAQRPVKVDMTTENEAAGTPWYGEHQLFGLWQVDDCFVLDIITECILLR